MSTCLFCKIVEGQIPAKRVHEDAQCLGFSDINPQAPHHVLFIPKKHIASLNEASSEERELLGHLMVSAAKYAKEQGFSDSGYRLVVNTQSDAGQTVFHVHVHLLGGRQLRWPPG